LYIRGTFLKQLSSLPKISVSILLIFFQLNASGGIPYAVSAGAGEAGMGDACILKTGFWSSFRNQALLAFNESYSFGLNYENRFGIRELGTRTAGVLIPAGKTSVGAAYSHFGCADFKRDLAGLACGMKLSEKLAAGVQIDFFSERTSGEYNNIQRITFEAGMIASPTENVRIGFHLVNPVPNSLRKTHQPMTLTLGAGTILSNTVFAGVEAEMSTGTKMILRTGFEYEAVKDLFLRAGYCTLNNSFCFGTGYNTGIVLIDLGFTSHDQLGITSGISLIFKIH
jgi:hypothetical protein